MKLNLPTTSAHAKPITSRDQLEAFMVEKYPSSGVQFSALTEHRLFGKEMFGWFDSHTGKGQLFDDSFAALNEAAEAEKAKKGIITPITKPEPLEEEDEEGKVAAKKKMESLDESRADYQLLAALA